MARGYTPKLMEHLSWMSDAIRLSPSIDNFLDRNSEPGDPTSIIGKLAIASIIGLREASSILANETQSVDWKSLSKTWLGKLWSLQNQGGIVRKLDNPLPNTAFITFNYDRSIERFITLAVSQSYRIGLDEAGEIAANVPCEHVYGSLGNIAPTATQMSFGGVLYPSQALESVKNIQTFTEQVESGVASSIKSILLNTDRIVFLGFSFGRMNREFLNDLSESGASLKAVHGTSFRMSEEDSSIAMNWADNCFRRGHAGSSLQNVKCAEFFDRNYLFFSA